MAHFGIAHGQVGGFLAKKWKLAPPIVEIIEGHHCMEFHNGQNRLLSIVILANNICKELEIGNSGNPVIEEGAQKFAKHLGITEEQQQEIKKRLPLELDKAEIFLQLGKG